MTLVLLMRIISIIGRSHVARFVLGRSTREEHLAIAEHEPHYIKGGIGTMYLSDNLIADFLITTVEQLRKSRTRDIAIVSELRIGNPSLLQKVFQPSHDIHFRTIF